MYTIVIWFNVVYMVFNVHNCNFNLQQDNLAEVKEDIHCIFQMAVRIVCIDALTLSGSVIKVSLLHIEKTLTE